MVDESTAWNDLCARYVVKTINHQLAYSDAGACTNGAESFFSRMRRAEQGHHHHISGVYLGRYAQESAWREDHRRVDNGAQVRGVVSLALARASHTGQAAGSRITGMRSCRPAMSPFAAVVAMLNVRSTSPTGSRQPSHRPAKANGAPSVRTIA